MGGLQKSVHASLDDILEKAKCNSSNPLWSKFLEAQAKRRSLGRKHMVMTGIKGVHIKSRRCRRTIMKRRARLERHRRPGPNELEKKVRILKKLVPNCESTGLERLFNETADYILALQMRVKVMQVMVNVLTDSSEE